MRKYDKLNHNAVNIVFDCQSFRLASQELEINESLIQKWKGLEILSWIEGYYNHVRLHSSID